MCDWGEFVGEDEFFVVIGSKFDILYKGKLFDIYNIVKFENF